MRPYRPIEDEFVAALELRIATSIRDTAGGTAMPERTERQHATVTAMIGIAERMAAQTKLIARRDVVEVGDVELTDKEDATLAEALRHIETAAKDLRQLRGAG